VVDVVGVLTDSDKPRDYWHLMKKRMKFEDGVQLPTICRQLKLLATDGKKYMTDVADVQSLLRIIQSVPSPKAEPFKRWLAKVVLNSDSSDKLIDCEILNHSIC